MRQQTLPIRDVRFGTKAFLVKKKLVYGGSLNYRKLKRPFLKTRAVHLVFRSRLLGGTRSLLKQNRAAMVESLLKKKAHNHYARLYRFSINSNHIHVLIKFDSSKAQANFLRDFSGGLALWLKRLLHLKQPLWDARPFSRLVHPKSFSRIGEYLERNRKEALGEWVYQPRPASELIRFLERIERKLTAGLLPLSQRNHFRPSLSGVAS